ncbi:hypothetical protein [Rhizobium phage RHEph21]|uniref:Lipoprotein n=1 Tax=Rhizobium phage RHEph21 TaxID=2836134 RepID=A0AAE7VMP5_9CAUD|nr:hypothetical protein [Rhizobium phage RHEph21]
MKKALLAIALAVMLASCTDRGDCLSSHTEDSGYMQYIYNGDGTVLSFYWVPTTNTVCDVWEFPEGRPQQ